MFQLSLQLEIPYVHIYLIGKLQDTYAHGYSRAFGKIGSTCILPAVARKCFLFWGSSETHMIQCILYSGSETTYISRVHVRILCTNIADQLKSILGCEKNFLSIFHDLLKIFRECCKNPLPTGASSGEGPVITHP